MILILHMYYYLFSDLSLVANTYFVQSGETKTLTINCTWETQSDESYKLAKISLIQTPSGKENTQVRLASIDKSNNKLIMLTDKAVGQGYLNTGIKSFLSLKWYYPLSEVAGEYTCEAVGEDDYSVTDKKTIDVTGFSESALRNMLLSVEKLEAKKKESVSMQSDVDKLKNALLNTNVLLNSTIQEFETLKSRINVSKHSYFKISDVYNGKRYYLSQYERIANMAASMATCILYGGYLAEIDDGDEFSFIKGFVRKSRGIRLILVGGNDEETEGTWMFEHSKKKKWITFLSNLIENQEITIVFFYLINKDGMQQTIPSILIMRIG
ncbi:C-type lectin domain family 3 member A isoform X2 [Biomphalaria glabrata]|nr:C-type lectin domain family 3 member A isoform X2 [Biomphalaria glabrata]